METKKKEVWQFVQSMNRLWTKEGKPQELKNYFHKNIIVHNPVDKFRLEGIGQCVNGWVAFVNAVKINYWEEDDPKILLYNNNTAAVVSYYYDMSYELSGEEVKSKGRDLFFLIKENGRWWIVADEFSEFPK